MGLNVKDGFLYGIDFLRTGPFNASNTRFYRLGKNGVRQQVGVIAGPTSSDAGRSIQFSLINTTAGVVDADGAYWFTAYSLTNFPTTFGANIPVANFDFFVGKVANVANLPAGNLNTVATTYYKLDISNLKVLGGFQMFLNQVSALFWSGGNITDADGGAEDIAIRPMDATIYSYVQFPTSFSGGTATLEHYPVKVNTAVPAPGMWKLEPVGNGVSNTTPNREIVGTYFDLLGRMYVLFSDGQYSEVNLNTGALVSLGQSSLPLANSNLRGDLASNITCATIPLNFRFMGFAGRLEGATTMLSWQTADDKAVLKYVVERCDDGISFQPVAEQRATGGGLYTATDVMPNSLATYRIKAVGVDDAVAYTNILRLAKPSIKGSVTTVYPTLLTGESVRVQTDRSAAIVQVVDLNGRILHTELVGGSRGENIGLPNVAAGTYILSVRDANTGEMLLNQRITKQ